MTRSKLKPILLDAGELLSREQMKDVAGGEGSGGSGGSCSSGPCSISIQGNDGNWITRTGNCSWGFDNVQLIACFCQTGLGNIPVTSNGGVSRCTV